MSEDGHKYFFGQLPEMPYKRKEREMDNEFKKLVLRLLILIAYAVTTAKSTHLDQSDYKTIDDANEYIVKLG